MLKNITPIYLFKFTQVAAEGRVRGGLAEGWGILNAYFYHLKFKSFLDKAINGGRGKTECFLHRWLYL